MLIILLKILYNELLPGKMYSLNIFNVPSNQVVNESCEIIFSKTFLSLQRENIFSLFNFTFRYLLASFTLNFFLDWTGILPIITGAQYLVIVSLTNYNVLRNKYLFIELTLCRKLNSLRGEKNVIFFRKWY